MDNDNHYKITFILHKKWYERVVLSFHMITANIPLFSVVLLELLSRALFDRCSADRRSVADGIVDEPWETCWDVSRGHKSFSLGRFCCYVSDCFLIGDRIFRFSFHWCTALYFFLRSLFPLRFMDRLPWHWICRGILVFGPPVKSFATVVCLARLYSILVRS